MVEPKSKNITCIIIDDEKDACNRLESLLQKLDKIDVLEKKTTAEDGIKAVIESYPDLVFLDIEMPGKSGFDVVRDLREKKIDPTFIFVTGYDQYAINAIRSAAFDYLLKPVDIDELSEAVERYREGQKQKQRLILPEKLKAKYELTNREIEIVKLLLEGKTSKEIGKILFISKHTVDTHRRNILGKVGVKTTNDLLNQLM